MVTEKIKFFNVSINDFKFKDIITLATQAIKMGEMFCIGYVNPHIIRLLNSDIRLQSALNKIDYLHADGFGIKLASIFLLEKSLEPLNWTDHALSFLSECEKRNWRIFFLGSSEEVLGKSIERIKTLVPKLQLAGFLNGYDQLNSGTINIINESNSNILWVGLGSPKQEIWLSENIDKLNINVAQCVGDLFSFIAGERVRGPKFMRDLGFEWLFRLIQHPFRYFNRYIIGIPYFLNLVVRYKLQKHKK